MSVNILTVDKLQPMSNLYENIKDSDKTVLAYRENDENPVILYMITETQLNNLYEYNEFIGWIFAPLYKPTLSKNNKI